MCCGLCNIPREPILRQFLAEFPADPCFESVFQATEASTRGGRVSTTLVACHYVCPGYWPLTVPGDARSLSICGGWQLRLSGLLRGRGIVIGPQVAVASRGDLLCTASFGDDRAVSSPLFQPFQGGGPCVCALRGVYRDRLLRFVLAFPRSRAVDGVPSRLPLPDAPSDRHAHVDHRKGRAKLHAVRARSLGVGAGLVRRTSTKSSAALSLLGLCRIQPAVYAELRGALPGRSHRGGPFRSRGPNGGAFAMEVTGLYRRCRAAHRLDGAATVLGWRPSVDAGCSVCAYRGNTSLVLFL